LPVCFKVFNSAKLSFKSLPSIAGIAPSLAKAKVIPLPIPWAPPVDIVPKLVEIPI
jgi:hypothetical protein